MIFTSLLHRNDVRIFIVFHQARRDRGRSHRPGAVDAVVDALLQGDVRHPGHAAIKRPIFKVTVCQKDRAFCK